MLVGPSMAGLARRAGETTASPDYRGQARTTEEYIRESIVDPSAHIVPGPTFSAGGQSVMPSYEKILTAEEIGHLVAYLATFK